VALSSSSHTAMREYPQLDALPANISYVFDTMDPRAIVIAG